MVDHLMGARLFWARSRLEEIGLKCVPHLRAALMATPVVPIHQPPLPTLLNETLAEIVGYVSKPDLSAVCVTNRVLHALGIHRLYSDIKVTRYNSLANLMESLAKHKDRLRMVRSLSLGLVRTHHE